jgi:DNA-3-methyladenine glycosylase II
MIADHSTAVSLPATAPFDFAASLRFLRAFPAMAGEQDATGQRLTKALRVAGQTVVAQLRAQPDDRALRAGDAGLRGELYSGTPLTPEAIASARDRIGFFLGLDDDLTDFYAVGRDDPGFAGVIERLHGYHQVKFPSPLENLVWAILVQRVPMPVATTAKAALVGHFDNRLSVAGVDHVAFPDLTQLTGLDLDGLAELVGNERKARYLHGALRSWAGVDEQYLRTGPYEQVKQFLLGLPGIGEWSANFLLIRGLGRMDQIPIDKPLLSTASRAYGRPMTEAEVRSVAARYGPWQGYWAHYLRAAG